MRKRNSIIIVLLCVLFVLLVSLCFLILLNLSDDAKESANLDQSILAGNYIGIHKVSPKISNQSRANIFKNGNHFLKLKLDHTYTYVYKPIDGNSIEINGLWQLERGYRGKNVVLSNFQLAPSAVSIKKRGYHSFPVDLNPIRLVISYDSNYYWIKQER